MTSKHYKKGDECPKCMGTLVIEGLDTGKWLECNNCGHIPTQH